MANYISWPLLSGIALIIRNRLIEIMKLQQEQDLILPRNERIGIGGEILFVHMKNESASVYSCYRFNNYESDYAEICKNL